MDNISYSFKDNLTNDYTYICKKRRKCKVVIKIIKEEIRKYNNNPLHKIKYIITSSESNHTCNQNSKEEEINWKVEEKKIDIDNKELINSLIYTNIEKFLSFHKNNLRTNNIYLNNNQIKWILQKLRK